MGKAHPAVIRGNASGTSFQQSPFQRDEGHANGDLSQPVSIRSWTREVRSAPGLRADRSELRSQ